MTSASSVLRKATESWEEAEGTEWLSPQLDPDLDSTRASMRQLLRDALSTSTREVVMAYYQLGRQDAGR